MFLVLCFVIILWSDIIIVIVTRKERVRKAGKALCRDEKGIKKGRDLYLQSKHDDGVLVSFPLLHVSLRNQR